MLSSDLKLVQGKARADAVRDINIMILENERDNFALENYDFKTSQKTLLRRLDLAETALSDESALKWTHTENTISMLERRVATMQIELLSMAEKDLYICAEHRTNGEQVSALHTHHHALLIKPT